MAGSIVVIIPLRKQMIIERLRFPVNCRTVCSSLRERPLGQIAHHGFRRSGRFSLDDRVGRHARRHRFGSWMDSRHGPGLPSPSVLPVWARALSEKADSFVLGVCWPGGSSLRWRWGRGWCPVHPRCREWPLTQDMTTDYLGSLYSQMLRPWGLA